jgi:hypothetical protein
LRRQKVVAEQGGEAKGAKTHAGAVQELPAGQEIIFQFGRMFLDFHSRNILW